MKKLSFVLVMSLVVASPIISYAQTPRWESMDGPYRPENRTHLRFPDGDRRFYGTNSGTFRTTDGGKSWINVGPRASSIDGTIDCCLSPNGVLFAHLGYRESALFHNVSVNRLFRSTDRGEHWEWSWGQPPPGSYLPPGPSLWGGVALGGGDTVYISYAGYDWASGANTGHIARSTDAGVTWTNVLTIYDSYVNGAELHIQNNNIFATRAVEVLPLFDVQRSTDGGTNWQRIRGENVAFYPPNTLVRQLRDTMSYPAVKAYMEFSTDEGGNWTRTLTADSGFTSLVSDNLATILVLRKPGLELHRSTDAGHTWTSLGSVPSGDPFTFLRFLGKTHVLGITKSGVYYRTTDNGTNWTTVLDPAGNPLTGTLQSASDSLLVVADFRGNWIESEDAGATWTSEVSPYQEQINCLLALPSGSLLGGGAGSLYRWREGERWTTMFNAGMSSISYRSGPSLLAGGTGITINNVGQSYSSVLTFDTAFSAKYPSIFGVSSERTGIHSIYTSASGSIIIGVGPTIKSASDHAYLRLAAGDFVAVVEDSSRSLWAANDSLGLYCSLDTGLTWNASNAGLTNLHTLSMAVASNGEIFVGTRGGGVFRSTDNGNSWAAAGLSSDTVQALLAGTEPVIYAGTSQGVFASTDDGATWSDISSGLTNTDVHALAQGPDGTIYCGTWGDGVYRLVGNVATPSGMILVEGGSFSMGSTSGDPDEQPVHSVTLHSFYLDSKEVTVAEFRDFCAATGRSLPPAPAWGWSDVLPMVNVTWDDAAAYGSWKGKRMPTEAEWEYAARGGRFSHGYLYSGSATVDSVAWDSATSNGLPHTGGSKPPNELGLYDLSGNVWEWCSDWYDAAYYGASPATDPKGPTPGAGLKVLRGGSFKNPPYACRVTDRTKFWFDSGLDDVGFRCAMDAPVSSTLHDLESRTPGSFALEQNYPNPFNPTTTIKYTVGGASGQWQAASAAGAGIQGPGARKTRLVVYDVLGRQVAVLVDEAKLPGSYKVTFDGSKLSSGVYFYRMEAGNFVQTRKLLLVK